MYYVTMTDKFLSGWGQAEGRIAKYVAVCDTYEEALIVKDNAERRKDQKNVNIRETKPYYDEKRVRVEFMTKADNPNWYVPRYFGNKGDHLISEPFV